MTAIRRMKDKNHYYINRSYIIYLFNNSCFSQKVVHDRHLTYQKSVIRNIMFVFTQLILDTHSSTGKKQTLVYSGKEDDRKVLLQ